MIPTDSSLRPSDRFCTILAQNFSKDGFILKGRKFERKFNYGKQVIDISFISTAGYIHGVEAFYHIIFDDIEKEFKMLFGKHWSNWTVHVQIGKLFRNLYESETNTYTDESLNNAATEFGNQVMKKTIHITDRFKTYEQLNQEYNQFPTKSIDVVPSNRFERRILMGLLLTKKYEPQKYDERKRDYFESFEKFDEFQREQQRDVIYEGIRKLDKLQCC